jgi:aldehyde dehydrogenase (NAD+)
VVEPATPDQIDGIPPVTDSYLQTAQEYPFREMRRSLKGATAVMVREPVGVVPAVTPWNVPLGDPREPVTQIGSVVSARQRGIVEGYLEGARAEGATAVVGGGRPDGVTRGWYVQPMVLTGVQPGMRVAREEIFGPVLSVLHYTDENDAVALANDSSFGLNGAVFTSDLEHGLQVAARIRTGTVEFNSSPSGQSASTGGVKASCIGREIGP